MPLPSLKKLPVMPVILPLASVLVVTPVTALPSASVTDIVPSVFLVIEAVLP